MTRTAAQTVAFNRCRTMPADYPLGGALLSEKSVSPSRRSFPAGWLEGVQEQLEELASLQENWDSYGACPISPEAIKAARDTVTGLAWIRDIEAPVVTGTPDGDVGLCWDHGDWSLDASIDSTGLINYVFLRTQPTEECESRTRDFVKLAERLTGM